MKIKKIIDVCKKEGRLTLISDPEGGGPQWIAAAGARYALVGVPSVTLPSLCALYDLDPEADISVEEIFGKPGLTGDEPLVMLPMWIETTSTVVPFKAPDGMVYLVREKYLAPFAKDREVSCVLKRDGWQKPTLVFRAGLVEIAEIEPLIPDEEFVSTLEAILSGVDDFLAEVDRRTRKIPEPDYEEDILR